MLVAVVSDFAAHGCSHLDLCPWHSPGDHQMVTFQLLQKCADQGIEPGLLCLLLQAVLDCMSEPPGSTVPWVNSVLIHL